MDRVFLIYCLAALGLATLYPTVRLVWRAAGAWQGAALASGAGLAAIRNTIGIALASVVTSGLLGSVLAFWMARYAFRGRRVLAALAYLPFTLPPLVGVLSFYYLIGRDGLAPRFIETLFGMRDASLAGPGAILLIHTYSFFVFFYAMLSAALENMDASQLEAARTLGATPWRAFTRVAVPMLAPALLGASLLTFMSSVASFSAPYFFGQDFPMLSVRIYDERMQFHHEAALTLTLALAAVSLVGVIVFRAGRRSRGVASKGSGSPLRPRRGRRLVPALLYAMVFVLLIPHMVIVWFSLVDHRAWHTELLPTRFTLGNYTVLFKDPGAFKPILNSLWMSALAAGMTLATALPAGYLIGRRRRGGRLVNLLAMIPWALPGTVIAMNLIVAFNTDWLPLYNTVWLLPLAYFVRGVPLLTRMSAAAIEPFDASLLEAGRTLGGSRLFCFGRIVAPLLAPAVIAGAALVFVTSLGEFVTSILLYLPSNIPIAVKINMEWRGSVGTAFAYSVLLMALVAATFMVSRKFSLRQV